MTQPVRRLVATARRRLPGLAARRPVPLVVHERLDQPVAQPALGHTRRTEELPLGDVRAARAGAGMSTPGGSGARRLGGKCLNNQGSGDVHLPGVGRPPRTGFGHVWTGSGHPPDMRCCVGVGAAREP